MTSLVWQRERTKIIELGEDQRSWEVGGGETYGDSEKGSKYKLHDGISVNCSVSNNLE